MKKQNLLLPAILALAIASCKKEKNDQSKDIPVTTLIIGNWKATSIAEIDYTDGIRTGYDTIANYPLIQFKQFNKDGTGTSTNNLFTYEKFNFSISGRTLTLTNDTVTDYNDKTKSRLPDRVFKIIKVNSATLGLYYEVPPYVEDGKNKSFTQNTYYTRQ
ncbi:lipocalin family protein [Mucilaginibacter sp. P25]|uniref:Lipocalin-like domain-containing protein n=1 Tax=Mucilaginibacter gossypii TaxID=551996 RepID=A0A1G7WTX3_9SPHI|nr:lipocalin family protein [Mucilaginibacter gossypii]SDG75397.1 Lipocalin-like domain-containing protein [Mucilaginibacter gossypii]